MKTLFICLLLLASAAAQSITLEIPTFIARGGTAAIDVTCAPSQALTGPLTPSVSGLPTGVTGSFSPTTIPNTGGVSKLSLTASSSASISWTSILLSCTSGSTTSAPFPYTLVTVFDAIHTTSVSRISPSSQSEAQGASSAVFTVQYLAGPPTSNLVPVALNYDGGSLPNGITVTFSPAVLDPSGGTTIATMTAASSVLVGSYNLLFFSNAYGNKSSSYATLTVTAP